MALLLGSAPIAAAREAYVADLAALVLPKAELGVGLPTLVLDDDSGPTRPTQIADLTFAPNDTLAQVRARGLIASYNLDYTVSGDLIGRSKKGLLTGVGSRATLFSDAAHAAAFLDGEFAEAAAAVGTTRNGVKLDLWEPFSIAAGEKSAAAVGRSSAGTVTVSSTGAYIQRGALVLEVKLNGEDPATSRVRVGELAARIDARAIAILDGSLAPTPVRLPWDRPVGAPDLARYTVGPRAFGLSVGISGEQWSRSAAVTASIVRSVEAAGNRSAVGLRHGAYTVDVSLFRRDTVAASVIAGIERRDPSSIAVQAADILQSILGGSVKATGATRVPINIRGIDATGYIVRASSDLGPIVMEQIYVRSGSLLARIDVIAAPPSTSGRIDTKRHLAIARAQAALLVRANKAGIGASKHS